MPDAIVNFSLRTAAVQSAEGVRDEIHGACGLPLFVREPLINSYRSSNRWSSPRSRSALMCYPCSFPSPSATEINSLASYCLLLIWSWALRVVDLLPLRNSFSHQSASRFPLLNYEFWILNYETGNHNQRSRLPAPAREVREAPRSITAVSWGPTTGMRPRRRTNTIFNFRPAGQLVSRCVEKQKLRIWSNPYQKLDDKVHWFKENLLNPNAKVVVLWWKIYLKQVNFNEVFQFHWNK